MNALAESATSLITGFRERLDSVNEPAGISVVLIGSVARGTSLAQSDLDLLVVSESTLSKPNVDPPLHVQYFTHREFTERLAAGDDFAAWCVRFGIPLSTSPVWGAIQEAPEASRWPDWRLKLPHAARRLHMTAKLLQLGDYDSAAEEGLYALTHIGRAVLLRANEFPLSRPEMLGQLQDMGQRSLAKLLQEFVFGTPSPRRVNQVVIYVKRLLVSLDRQWYSHDAAERRKVALLKAASRTKNSAQPKL